jgi:hypothetical protein
MFADFPGQEARLNPYVGGEDSALPTNSNLLGPTPLNLPLTQCPADKPAELAHAQFRGRASLSRLGRTSVYLPAGAHILKPLFCGREKQHLPFHMGWNFSPPLFEALHGPDRNSQKLGHCPLGFLQPLAKGQEFVGVHRLSFLGEKIFRLKFFLDSLYHIVLLKETLFSEFLFGCPDGFQHNPRKNESGCRKLKNLRPSG